MQFLYWLALGILTTVFMTKFVGKRLRRFKQIPKGVRIALVATVSCVAWLSPAYYEFPSQPFSTVVSINNGHVIRHPFGMFGWEWSKNCIILPTQPVKVTGSVAAITPNPKVRKIYLTLEVSITDADKFFSVPERIHSPLNADPNPAMDFDITDLRLQNPDSTYSEIGRATASATYVYINEHSKELSSFSNPTDRTELAEMRKLVEPWLNERLAPDGLRVSLKSFNVKY